jgi:hypothetical protein
LCTHTFNPTYTFLALPYIGETIGPELLLLEANFIKHLVTFIPLASMLTLSNSIEILKRDAIDIFYKALDYSTSFQGVH